MRELKFRAWSEETESFEFFDLYEGTECGLTNLQIWARNAQIEQYTGLKDKNGKEIYEGDILERKRTVLARDSAYPAWGKDHIEIRRASIVFENGSFYGRSTDSGISAQYSWKELGADFEVIGNIHENSELLEGKK